jgi:hypothetical protein
VGRRPSFVILATLAQAMSLWRSSCQEILRATAGSSARLLLIPSRQRPRASGGDIMFLAGYHTFFPLGMTKHVLEKHPDVAKKMKKCTTKIRRNGARK